MKTLLTRTVQMVEALRRGREGPEKRRGLKHEAGQAQHVSFAHVRKANTRTQLALYVCQQGLLPPSESAAAHLLCPFLPLPMALQAKVKGQATQQAKR